MAKSNDFVIRIADISDIENLKLFFTQAYGVQTVFQSERFLKYYFNNFDNKKPPLSNNIIALDSVGNIISHYGGIKQEFILKDKIISIIWGVNAYTLPEWRGKGINTEIVELMQRNNEANAVISMPSDAPYFYEKIGYNIFQKDRLDRFVYITDTKAYDVVQIIGQDYERAKSLLPIKKKNIDSNNSLNVIEITKNNFNTFKWDFEIDSISTTNRSEEFLKWRLFENPFINYSVLGYIIKNHVKAYIVIREEILEPTNFNVKRIIDLFGEPQGIKTLLNFVILNSDNKAQLYFDFYKYGKLYEDELLSSGFIKLKNEDVALLPQVSSPIENRPNHEFVVVQSKIHNSYIQNLSAENVYFTRLDSDRDRINRLSQIKAEI